MNVKHHDAIIAELDKRIEGTASAMPVVLEAGTVYGATAEPSGAEPWIVPEEHYKRVFA